MRPRFRLFRRSDVYYVHDHVTGKQHSLFTRHRKDALRLFAAKNEAHQQPGLNLQLARVYMTATDPAMAVRTWNYVMETIMKTKHGPTLVRWDRACKDHAFDGIRKLTLLATRPDHFLGVLEAGTVATNIYLRRLHNFALDMNWLPCSLIPKRQWPKVEFKPKRAITIEEHQAIVRNEHNPERRAFYALAWHLGAAQSDLAALTAENIDWRQRVIRFFRKKTRGVAVLRFSDEMVELLRALPQTGSLFPEFSQLREAHRATEFKRACRRLGISGVTLHSYRYAWAERAKNCGYPERFAQTALGHNSRAVHEAYAGGAIPTCPPLDDYERAMNNKIVPLDVVLASNSKAQA